MESVKEFIETLPERIPAEKAAGVTSSYVIEIHEVGIWLVAVDDGKVAVTEGEAEADVRIGMSEETFRKLVAGEQNAMRGFMTGKIKVKGDVGAATKLGKLFG